MFEFHKKDSGTCQKSNYEAHEIRSYWLEQSILVLPGAVVQ